MLTLSLLLGLWILALVSSICMLVCLWRRRWLLAGLFYVLVGLLGIATPFKISLHATSAFAMLFLSIVWPAWLLQTPLGFDILNHTPEWFQHLMFTFS